MRKKFTLGLHNKLSNISYFAAASVTANLPPLPKGQEIYGIMPEMEVPLLIPVWVWVLLGLFIIAAILLLKYINKSSAPKPNSVIKKPKIHPKVAALRALRALTESEAMKTSNYREVALQIPRILKTYACDWYSISFGSGATSDEFLKELDNCIIKPETEHDIKFILQECDKVMFLGGNPDRSKINEMLDLTESLVRSERW